MRQFLAVVYLLFGISQLDLDVAFVTLVIYFQHFSLLYFEFARYNLVLFSLYSLVLF